MSISALFLCLLPSSGDTAVQQERARSPVPTFLSMKRDGSMERIVTLKQADNSPEHWYINISISPSLPNLYVFDVSVLFHKINSSTVYCVLMYTSYHKDIIVLVKKNCPFWAFFDHFGNFGHFFNVI